MVTRTIIGMNTIMWQLGILIEAIESVPSLAHSQFILYYYRLLIYNDLLRYFFFANLSFDDVDALRPACGRDGSRAAIDRLRSF